MDGYFDESGDHGPGGNLRRLTLGGFFAPWQAVERLQGQWREALAIESMGEFHMSEFASDEHNYPMWPKARRDRLDRFVSILIENAAAFAAFTYEPRNKRRQFYDAYEAGLGKVLIVAASLSDQLKGTGNDRGNVIFARTHEIKGELIGRYFDRLRWSEFLDGYSILASRNTPALQAAEIMARGMRRVMQDGVLTHSFQRVLTCGKLVRIWPEDLRGALGMRGIQLRPTPPPQE